MTAAKMDEIILGLCEARERLKGIGNVSRNDAIRKINDGIDALREFKRHGMAAFENVQAECGMGMAMSGMAGKGEWNGKIL